MSTDRTRIVRAGVEPPIYNTRIVTTRDEKSTSNTRIVGHAEERPVYSRVVAEGERVPPGFDEDRRSLEQRALDSKLLWCGAITDALLADVDAVPAAEWLERFGEVRPEDVSIYLAVLRERAGATGNVELEDDHDGGRGGGDDDGDRRSDPRESEAGGIAPARELRSQR
jgi:hypothetical protein